MTSRPDNKRSANGQPDPEGPGSSSTPDEVQQPAETTPGTTIPGMMPIIDVRAKSIEGDAVPKNSSTTSRPKTDRGQDMFPNVAEVPPEYSDLFQDYDNASTLGVDAPLWLDGTEHQANSRFGVPGLVVGGVVLTALASGMGLAQLHNMRQASAKPDPKSPPSPTAEPRTGDRSTSIAKANASTQPGAKAASLASPETLRPNWLTPSAKATTATKTASANATGSLASSPIVLGTASGTSTSAIPPLILPSPKTKTPALLTPSLTSPISARPMLSIAPLSSSRIFPARLTYPVVRPASVTATRPAVRPIISSTIQPASRSALSPRPTLSPTPDRFSSITSATTSGEPKLRSVEEVVADRLSQSGATGTKPRQNQPGKSQQARAVDNQGNEFGYEALRALRPAAPVASPGSETAQWDATNRVITTTAATAATVATPGMATLSMPALSISVQDSLTPESNSPNPAKTILSPAAEAWSPPESNAAEQPLEPRLAPKASNLDPTEAPQAMAPSRLELAAIPSGSLDRTISSPEYSGTEYSSPE